MSEEIIEQRTCSKHGEYEAKLIAVPFMDRMLGGNCPQCAQEAEARREADEKRQAELARKARIDGLHRSSGIPQRFADASFTRYAPPTKQAATNHALCRSYAQEFADKAQAGASLVLCGKPGTGKTHLACAVANHVIKKLGQPAIYTSATKLSRAVKATYNRDADQTEDEVIKSFVAPALLVIDEVGAQRGSETELLLAQEVIDERYQQLRPTIVISNLPEAELARFIGERALDRMYEGGGAVLAFDWGSYRRGVA